MNPPQLLYLVGCGLVLASVAQSPDDFNVPVVMLSLLISGVLLWALQKKKGQT